MKPPIAFAALVISLLPQAPGSAAPPTRATLDQAIRANLQRWNVPGAAVAVVKDGQVIMAEGFGLREQGASGAVDRATSFYTASVTKTFTMAALGMLADEGKLRIDDPVTKYVPGFGVADADTSRLATVRDLMAHRTGLPRADLLMFAGLTNDEVIARMRLVAPVAPLRTRFTYQNQMYLTLGQIVANLAQTSWQSVIETRLMARLGMQDSNAAGLGHPRAAENAAVPHALVNDQAATIDYVPRPPYGAGGVNASARDMARWLQFILGDGAWNGEKILGPQVLAATQQPNTITSPTIWMPDANFALYGLGWFLNDYRGKKVVQHGGNGEGWTSLVWMLPGEKLGVAVLTNMHNTLLPWAIAHQVADAYLGGGTRDWTSYFLDAERARNQAAARQRPARGTSPIDSSAWLGEWRSQIYGTVTVSLREGEPWLAYGSALEAHLVAGTTAADAVALWKRSDLDAVLGPTAVKRIVRNGQAVLAINFGGDIAEFTKGQ